MRMPGMPAQVEILEVVSYPPQRDEGGGEVEEGQMQFSLMLMPDEEPTEAVKPRDTPFDDPAALVAARGTTVLGARPCSPPVKKDLTGCSPRGIFQCVSLVCRTPFPTPLLLPADLLS
jgi:hypothetical protein